MPSSVQNIDCSFNGCYWISPEVLILALLSLHKQVYPTYPILSPLTINYALVSLPAFNLDPMFIQGQYGIVQRASLKLNYIKRPFL